MGTNYYLVNNCCESCKRYDRAIHLGKASGGWTFTFRGYRQQYAEDYRTKLNVQNFNEWCEMIETQLAEGYQIKDEYGSDCSQTDLFSLIERKRSEPNNHAMKHPSDSDWVDIDDNSFSSAEFC